MTFDIKIPVLGIVGFSGTGKTTLLKKLLPKLADQGIRVGMIKHAHHNFDIDKPGKDSYELRKAGALQMLVASSQRWALMVENNTEKTEPTLEDLISHLNLDQLDVILVEGFKHEKFHKLELHRNKLNQTFLFLTDPSIIAIASDEKLGIESHPTWMDINDVDAVLAFVVGFINEFN